MLHFAKTLEFCFEESQEDWDAIQVEDETKREEPFELEWKGFLDSEENLQFFWTEQRCRFLM